MKILALDSSGLWPVWLSYRTISDRRIHDKL